MTEKRQLAYELTGLGIAGHIGKAEQKITHTDRLDIIIEGLKEAGYTALAAMPLRYLQNRDGSVRECLLPIRFWGNTWDCDKSHDSDWKRLTSVGLYVIKTAINKTADFSIFDTKGNTTPVDFVAFPPHGRAEHMYRSLLEENDTKDTFLTIAPHSPAESVAVLADIADNFKHHVVMPEVSGGFVSRDKFIDWAKENNQRLTLDTWHLRESAPAIAISMPRSPIVYESQWREYAESFVDLVGLVHFQPSRRDSSELTKTLNGENTELTDIVTFIAESGFSGSVVVEHQSPVIDQIVYPERIVSQARDIAEYVQETIGISEEE